MYRTVFTILGSRRVRGESGWYQRHGFLFSNDKDKPTKDGWSRRGDTKGHPHRFVGLEFAYGYWGTHVKARWDKGQTLRNVRLRRFIPLPALSIRLPSNLAMSTNPKPTKPIQRGPPNMFNLPDMFREIAGSLRRWFRRTRASRASRRQGTCSTLNVITHSTT
jgi:hypothetical protein